MRSERARSGAVRPGSTPRASTAMSFSARHCTLAPRSSSRPIIASTSRIRGTLRRTTSSSVRRQAASRGSAAFLFPAGVTVPDSGTPPSMTNFSMGARPPEARRRAPPRGWARVTPMSLPLSREESWTLFCEWTESESLRRHVLAVEYAMRAYARKFGEDEELWGATGMLHDLDYERYPDLETGH